MKAKQKRELELLMKLERDHGFTFHEMPRESDRSMMFFHHNRKTGKTSLTSDRMMRVSAPRESWLATEMDKLIKAKGRATTARRARKPTP